GQDGAVGGRVAVFELGDDGVAAAVLVAGSADEMGPVRAIVEFVFGRDAIRLIDDVAVGVDHGADIHAVHDKAEFVLAGLGGGGQVAVTEGRAARGGCGRRPGDGNGTGGGSAQSDGDGRVERPVGSGDVAEFLQHGVAGGEGDIGFDLFAVDVAPVDALEG